MVVAYSTPPMLGWGVSRTARSGIGVVLFLIALVVHAIPHLFPGGFGVTLMGVLSPLLIPALWGGVGACTFLAKHLSNRLSEQSYERVRQQGDVVRIFLGAMIGVFAVVVFTDFGSPVGELGPPAAGDTSGGETGADDPAPIAMGPVVIAFPSGLAVKPIYAAIETLGQRLGETTQRQLSRTPMSPRAAASLAWADQSPRGNDGRRRSSVCLTTCVPPLTSFAPHVGHVHLAGTPQQMAGLHRALGLPPSWSHAVLSVTLR